MDSSSAAKIIQINCEGAHAVAWQELHPFQGDLKKLTIENYEKFKAEILRDGYCEPITVWRREFEDDGVPFPAGGIRWTILNGHQRLATIREMVETEGYQVGLLPVSIVRIRDEQHANDLVLALTSQYGEMSVESVAKFAKERGIKVELIVQRYRFPEVNGKELVRICSEPQRQPDPEGAPDQDEAPEPPKQPRSRRGDLYFLGPHILLCGDSTRSEEVLRLLTTNSELRTEEVDLVFTDPPYNIASENKGFASNSDNKQMGKLMQSAWDKDFDPRLVPGIIDNFCAKNATVYICTSHHLFGDLVEGLKDKFDHTGFCVWSKTNPMPSLAKRHWTGSAELIVYATRGKHTFNFPDVGHAFSVWSFPKVQKCDVHPTMKPVKVVEHALAHSSKPGDIVLDLFGGSGTTLIACQALQRRCRIMEIDPKYVDVIVDRWEKLTGQFAELVRA